MKVEVRPIDIKKWHGKKGKDSFAAPKKIKAFVNGQTRQYTTGIGDIELKHLKKVGCQYDLSSEFTLGVEHSFWDAKVSEVILENNTQIFETNNVLDYIKVALMKANKFVANSVAEAEEGIWPEATHYIYSELEEESVLASRAELKNKANLLLSKLTKERKLEIALLLGKKNLRQKSEDALIVEMDNLVTNKTGEFVELATRDKALTSLEALVAEAILENKLQKRKMNIMYGDVTLGTSVKDVALYLQEEEGNELKLRLIGELR